MKKMEAPMPARIIYDLIIQSLETNVRLAESMASLMQGMSAGAKRPGEPKNGQGKKEEPLMQEPASTTGAPRKGGRWVFRFGAGRAEGSAEMRDLLGGKGANLAEMADLGLPVPPGFTISTEMCDAYYKNGKRFRTICARRSIARSSRSGEGGRQVRRSGESAARLGPLGRARLDAGHDGHGPQSRPQRRDRRGARRTAGDPRFAWDSYRRFIQMYSDVVLGHRSRRSSRRRSRSPRKTRASSSTPSSTAEDWQELVAELQGRVVEELGQALPAGRARAALGRDRRGVRLAGNRTAPVTYRRLNDIPGDWGTAVNVQAMVFGNMGETSATGVAFTRDPVDRRDALLWRIPDQRAGRGRRRRHPHAAVSDRGRARDGGSKPASMEEAMPEVFAELARVFEMLEDALPRHAGHRVHGAAGQALDAADPHRQAHRQGGAQDRGRHGRAKA